MPFSKAQFFSIFTIYNSAVSWGLALFYVLAGTSLVFLLRQKRTSFPLLVLAGLWIWMGIVYHGVFFLRINPAAMVFSAAFVLQGFLLVMAWRKQWVSLDLTPGRVMVGLILIIYALIVYPILGIMFGHGYPNGPVFGLPCPTTIFHFGVFSFFRLDRWHWLGLAAIPLLWSLVGTSAAIYLAVYEDYALLVSAMASLFVHLRSQPGVSNV